VVAARRIGAGHLRGEINLPQHDELGELGAEMNAMRKQLVASREKVDQEAAARLAAVEQLRHAERLTTVGKLASGIAHELGTPLNVVGVRAQLLMREHPRGSAAHEHAHSIYEQIERMSGIIRQLLDFARRRQAHTSRQDVRQLTRQTVAMLRALAEKRGVTVRVEGEDAPIHASVDAGQLQQALTNLIVNGLEATPAGGNLAIELRSVATTPPPDVGGAAGDYLVIRVTDDGSGMPPDVAARVFEPFFTTKEVGQGTGLGLSVTHGIIRDHGGWMTLETQVGKGSCFSVFLPVERAS
jgi:signal transduction histidine kinase